MNPHTFTRKKLIIIYIIQMANLSLQFSFSVLAVLILLELSFCHLAMATYYSGVATYQNGDIVPNSCFGNDDQGIFGARLRAGMYDNACNHYYKVKCEVIPRVMEFNHIRTTIRSFCQDCES